MSKFLTIKQEISYESPKKEFRVHVDPTYLMNRENFALVRRILEEVFEGEEVDIKIIQLDDQQALKDFDGTTNSFGNDRDQRGKEVCIYLPSIPEGNKHNIEHLKKLMLTLWYKLQQANVPLHSFTPPGDKAIRMESFSTPFSFTFTTAPKEWQKRHGILFKDCEHNNDFYDPNHPLHHIQFSAKNIRAYELQFDKAKAKAAHIKYLKDHFKSSLEQLLESIDFIRSHERSFAKNDEDKFNFNFELLTIKEGIEKIQQEYNEEIGQINLLIEEDEKCERRGAARTRAIEKLQELVGILKAFPHHEDSDFTAYEEISLLLNDSLLNREDLSFLNEELEKKLSERLDIHIKGLIEDFRGLEGIINPRLQDSYERIIEDIETITANNPCEAQKIFRRFVFLNREANYIDEETKNISQLCQTAVGNYTQDRPFTLGYFSRFFDNERGRIRAQTFRDLFAEYSEDQAVLDLLIYSLLASNNGTYLKYNIAASLGYASTNEARAIYEIKVKEHLAENNNHSIGQLNNEVIEPIVNATNNKKDSQDKTIVNALEIYKNRLIADKTIEIINPSFS